MCELHSHTRWSDGHLKTRELVELYARHRFDVLCVTDHVVRDGSMVSEERFGDYLGDVGREARRARELYDMLVIPGLELTRDDENDPDDSAHAVAIGLDTYVGLDDGFEAALEEARDRGAAVVAAHPHGIESDELRITRRWWLDRGLRSLAHRFELVNRHQVFAWVAAEGLPSVASGDAHIPEHVGSWKTLVPAARHAADVVDYLRSGSQPRSPASSHPAGWRAWTPGVLRWPARCPTVSYGRRAKAVDGGPPKRDPPSPPAAQMRRYS